MPKIIFWRLLNRPRGRYLRWMEIYGAWRRLPLYFGEGGFCRLLHFCRALELGSDDKDEREKGVDCIAGRPSRLGAIVD